MGSLVIAAMRCCRKNAYHSCTRACLYLYVSANVYKQCSSRPILAEMGDDDFDDAFPDVSVSVKRRRRRRHRDADASVVAADNARVDEDGAFCGAAHAPHRRCL
jgi:hypothetical protein